MKRDIYCLDCELSLKRGYEREQIDANEYRSIHGFARRNFLCDMCNAAVNAGEPCACFTVRFPQHGEEFYDWENEYIMPLQQMFGGVSDRDLKTAKGGKSWSGGKDKKNPSEA